MAGINPFARLMILKALNNFGHTRASYVAEAITYAADNGARVINLSVGGKEISEVEQAAIDYAYWQGRGHRGRRPATRASMSASMASPVPDKVLTVATTGFDDQRAVFSNWGKVSVAAPGLDILSLRGAPHRHDAGHRGRQIRSGAAFVGEDKRYYRASGTSFSAPIVSGLASLMIANDPALTNRQVMAIIKSTARDVGTPGVDQFTGYGIVDAVAALKAPKDYLLAAGIDRVEVVQASGKAAVRVRGTADANALKAARIEIGQGDAPASWTRVARRRKARGLTRSRGNPCHRLAGREGLADTCGGRTRERGDTGSTVQAQSGLAFLLGATCAKSVSRWSAWASLAFTPQAWAIVGETTVKVADAGTPIPQATITVTFKDQSGKPLQTVKRPTLRTGPGSGTRKVTIPDNTKTVDIFVTTANGRTATRTGVDVVPLINTEIVIDVPGGSAPPQTAGPGSRAPGPGRVGAALHLSGRRRIAGCRPERGRASRKFPVERVSVVSASANWRSLTASAPFRA